MGIKFHCPNGHKLNVKSFLAGKKGVCPKCGIRVRIPTASEEAADDSGIGAAQVAAGVAVAAGLPAAGANGSARPGPAVVAAPTNRLPAPTMPGPVMPAPAMPMGTAVAVPAMPVPAMPVPAMPLPPAVAAADPIAEAPGATWYVRPPGGGQYGPARGDVMRKWIAEGRVSSDSLVWREGWADWRNASQLFPNLASAGTAAGPVIAAPIATSSTPSAAARYRPRKSGNGMAIVFLVGLAFVCVVLVGVLVYVLTMAK